MEPPSRLPSSGSPAALRNAGTDGSRSHGATACAHWIAERTQQSSISPTPGHLSWLNTNESCTLLLPLGRAVVGHDDDPAHEQGTAAHAGDQGHEVGGDDLRDGAA